MANVLFCVIVLFCIQQAFGNRNCNEKEIKTCNECIRCGGNWCSEPGNAHCSMSPTDDWCVANREEKPWMTEEKLPGEEIEFKQVVRTAEVMETNEFSFKYKADKEPNIDINFINSTQGNILIKNPKTRPENVGFKTTIITKPTKSFCWDNGTSSEFVQVEVHLEGFKETLAVTYHVPCACDCSAKVETSAAICKGNGNYTCGICTCEPKWTGVFCEKRRLEVPYPLTPTIPVANPEMGIAVANPEIICPKRGDIAQCSGGIKPDVECSGNGYCGPCETCICYTDREGFQYFDQDNYCTDLCMLTNNDCEDCLANRSIGECQSCRHLTIQSYNETLRNEMYGQMKVWVKCNETIDNCLIEYVAKKTNDGQIFVMIEKTCDDGIIADEYKSVKVSITLGVLGMLAALAAVAGVMYYKYLNAAQPLSSHVPGYSNIDAEDCTGINPLYKPPTTKFTNPTYGKKL